MTTFPIPCLCACCEGSPGVYSRADGSTHTPPGCCSGRTEIEPGVAADRCPMCSEWNDGGCEAGFVSESDALDRLEQAGLTGENHAIAVDALGLRYRPDPRPVDRDHEARVLALVSS